MEVLIAALPDLKTLHSLHITVRFEGAGEEPYSRMLHAVCALPVLYAFHLTDNSVMDHHILSLAAAFNEGMVLEVLHLDLMPATEDTGGVFGAALSLVPNIRDVHFMDSSVAAGGCSTTRDVGRPFNSLEIMRFDRMVFHPGDLTAIHGEWLIFPNVHTLQLGFEHDRYGSGQKEIINLEVRESPLHPMSRCSPTKSTLRHACLAKRCSCVRHAYVTVCFPQPAVPTATCAVRLCVCEKRDCWLVAWGMCGRMLTRSSTVWLPPFTLL